MGINEWLTQEEPEIVSDLAWSDEVYVVGSRC